MSAAPRATAGRRASRVDAAARAPRARPPRRARGRVPRAARRDLRAQRDAGFLTFENLRGILASVAVLGVVALGVNQVVLAGDIDISVGSMLGAVRGRRSARSAPSVGGLLLPLLAGDGGRRRRRRGQRRRCSTLARIPSIIVTLGMLYALRGLDAA